MESKPSLHFCLVLPNSLLILIPLNPILNAAMVMEASDVLQNEGLLNSMVLATVLCELL